MYYFVSFFLVIFLLSSITFGMPVSAHEGHDHTDTQVVSHESLMRQIALLEQVITLLKELRAREAVEAAVVPSSPHEAEVDEQMEEHMEEMHHEEAVSTQPSLVIEIEAHHGSTHVHVRYVDKPEDMFFVSPSMDETDALVAAIVAKTGLTETVVRPALVFYR